MRDIMRRLRARYGKKTWLVIAMAAISVCLLGGGAYAALGGSVLLSSSGDINLQKGLVGHFKFDGDGKNATPYNATCEINFVGGPLVFGLDRKNVANQALYNTSRKNLTCTGGKELAPSSAVTFSGWVRPDDLDASENNGILALEGGAFLYMTKTDGRLTMSLINNANVGTTFNSPVSHVAGQWYHVAGTFDGSTVKLYVNGQEEYSSAYASTFGNPAYHSQTTVPLRVATYSAPSSTRSMNGYFDDLRVYDRGLNANEVKMLYESYNSRINPATGQKGLLGYWKMNGNLKDATPNSNHGTLSTGGFVADRNGRGNAGFSGTASAAGGSGSSLYNIGQIISISLWYRRDSDGTFYSTAGLDKATTSSNATFRMTVFGTNGGANPENAGKIQFTGAINGSYMNLSNPSAPISNGAWHHVAWTLDLTTKANQLYVDGVSQGTIAIGPDNASLTSNTEPLIFDAPYIDDVRVYNRILSSTEVGSLYHSYDSQLNLNSSPTNNTTAGNVNQGLVGYWPFSGNARDATPYSNNGTVTGATLTTDRKGRTNSAYAFDGTSHSIVVPDGNSMRLVGDLTLSAWIKLNSGNTQYNPIISKGGANEYEMAADLRSGNTHLSWRSNSTGSTDITNFFNGYTSMWVHVAVTVQGNTVTAYRNGISQGTLTIVPRNVSTNDVAIGKRSASPIYFGGSIDESRIYNRALSAIEIQSLYNSQN